LPLHSNPNPPTSWFLDPFSTLPSTSELPLVVAHLVYYCESYHLLGYLDFWHFHCLNSRGLAEKELTAG
jgi:hypothetical protein